MRYVFLRIGHLLVSDIKHADVLAVLKPVWFELPQTGSRLLQRMEAVFRSAILRGQRERASPCLGVTQELGRHNRGQRFRALPYAEVPAFLQSCVHATRGPAVNGWHSNG